MLVTQADSNVASNVLGWISIACWVIVYSPQIVENYQLQSGEGLSLLFVYIWLLGDLCNLGGALMAHLLPTVIILAIYYTICDSVLLFQVYYYRWKLLKGSPLPVAGDATEDSYLLGEAEPAESQPSSMMKLFLKYTAAVAFVIATGVAAYFISERINHDGNVDTQPEAPLGWSVQVLGWTSAISYRELLLPPSIARLNSLLVSARLPQILKNFKTRCEGLAPGLFLFAILGNTTYSLSIIVVSTDRDYLIRNASWLAGSGLTVLLDVFVLAQFLYYGFVSRHREWIDSVVRA
ncbi:PQ-loop-domain-containing protein [Phlebopus sp. FC_14]|nr:PQ-loop-domain-containing protein [Phlebopus sp. FC_14]